MISARPQLYFHRRLSYFRVRTQRDLAHAAVGKLPPKLKSFVGRHSAIQFLIEQIKPVAQPRIVISGAAGMGKSAFAIEFAHRQFESQYYANLRGSNLEPLDPAIVLAQWLRSGGVNPIPHDLKLRLQRFQTLLDQSAILVLDDVQNQSQVTPFLELNCAILITSRKPLAIEGAIGLELPHLEESLALFQQQIGFFAIDMGLDASQKIVQACDRVPLAIKLAIGAINQIRSVQEFETQLEQQKALIDPTLEDRSVRSLFELNYQKLDSNAARLLRLLSLLVVSHFSSTLAATVLQSSEATAIEAIQQLAALRLVTVDASNYRFAHDLIRLYARQRLAIEETIAQRQAARALICDWYLEQIESFPLELSQPSEQVLNWFEAERLNLISAIEDAEQAQAWETVVRLANGIAQLLDECGDHVHARRVLQSAIAASNQLSDPFDRAATLNNLGNLALRQEQWQQARSYYEQSLRVFSQLDFNYRVQQAKTLANLGVLDALEGQTTGDQDSTAAVQWTAALKLLRDTDGSTAAAMQRWMQSIDADLLKAAGGTVSDDLSTSSFFQNFTQKLKRLLD